TGTVRVIAATIRDCANRPQAVDLDEPLTIPIDGAGPDPASALTTLSVAVPGSATRAVRLAFQVPADAESVAVYRAPFGGHPEYDDVPGAGPPPPPVSDPPPAPWQRTDVHDSGHSDFVATRDVWSYVVYAWDACGNRSAASAVSPPSTNYLLGDTRGGAVDCTGDGVVDALDL